MTVSIPQKRPLGITIVVVLADLGALLRLMGSAVVIVTTVAAPSQGPGGARAMMVGLSIFGGATALGILLVGHFLWRGANWARITFMAILLVALVVTVIRMLLAGVDGESVISIATSVVCLGILSSASAKGYCPPAAVRARSARLVVAGIFNIGYGALGYLILSLPALLAWTVVASRSYRAAAFYFRLRLIGPDYAPVLWLVQVGIAGAITACWLLCVCLVVSGIGILLMKEWARRMACIAAGAFLVSALMFIATVVCAEMADFPVLGSTLGLAGAAVLTALVVAALAWPVTVNFLLSTAAVKAQFAGSMVSEGPGEPTRPEDPQSLARVRRQERKELLWVCSGVIVFSIAVGLLGTALPGIRWRAAPREDVPPALKRPTRLMRQGKYAEAIPLLAEALRSDDVATWRRAANALTEIGEPAVPALAKLLKNGDKDISSRAEMVLSKMGPAAIAVYTERLKSPNERVRLTAVLRIAQMGAEGIPGLCEALKSTDRNVRVTAIEALRKIGAPAVPVLKGAVKDPDSLIRRRAIEILRQIAAHDTAAVEALADASTDESGKTLLHYAAEVGNTNAIESFIKEGADLNATDALGNTALSAIVEKMIMGPRHGEDYARYKRTAGFLIANGADVDATARFGRTLLQHARSLGREEVAEFLIAQGAQTHVDRRIYFKLPLEGVTFHWRFFDRTAYLQGHLVLRISGKDEVAQEITVFKQGTVADGWRILGAGSPGPIGDGAYFGFQSSTRYPTAQGDAVEIELEVAEDLLGGWGLENYGLLPGGTYQTKGRILGVSDEPQAFEVDGRQERSPGWTAFLQWDTRWKLVTDDADGIVARTCIKALESQDNYARLRAAQILGQLGDQSAAPALVGAMRGADKNLCGAIKRTLDRLGNPEIYVLDAQGGNPVNLTRSPARDASPAWSPDGTKIAFASDRDGDYEIYLMEADGSNVRRLTHSSGADSDPVWSPDGTAIAFRSQRDKNCEIYVMHADGTGAVNITNSPGCDHDPAWSSDGSKIAFQSTRNRGCDIYIMDPDGGNVVNATSRTGCDHHPVWLLDKHRIVFSSKQDGHWDLHSVHADGSRRELVLPGVCDAVIGLSPDGTSMVLAADDVMSPWLFAMNVDGSNARILNQLPGLCADPTWSPDGAALTVGVNLFDPSVMPGMIEAAKNSSIYGKCRAPAP